MTLWFTSDTHFGHTNIIKYCNRPYTSVEEMDEALVSNWNSVVSAKDKVYHLGDWAFYNFHHIGRLKGNIFTITGNHDYDYKAKILKYLPNGFEPELTYLKINKEQSFALCHYPLESWRKGFRYHLHGHTHGTAGVKYNRLDVGVDALKIYRPVTLEEVLERVLTTNIWATEMNK